MLAGGKTDKHTASIPTDDRLRGVLRGARKRLSLTDNVTISEHAWLRLGTFTQVGTQIPVDVLIRA